MISSDIKKYIESEILPRYDSFDKAHQIDHVTHVIDESLILAEQYEVNIDMAYVIAAFHDVGLCSGREGHEKKSGEILLADEQLKKWFSEEEILLMKEAAEDHRASNKHEPRTIYGKIVAEADRDISYDTIMIRTIQYSLKNFPELSMNGHMERTREHIVGKYCEGGYLKLWLNSKKNIDGLNRLRDKMRDKEGFEKDFQRLFEQELEKA